MIGRMVLQSPIMVAPLPLDLLHPSVASRAQLLTTVKASVFKLLMRNTVLSANALFHSKRAAAVRAITVTMAATPSCLRSYFACYRKSRTHLSLGKDAPEPRAVQPPSMGDIVELPEVGGLHHRYVRQAA